MLSRLFGSRDDARRAEALYDGIVGQARQPVFYRDWAVPDTLDGRFEMICLHAFLVMRRLKGAGPEAAKLSQALFDAMFADMDRSLREIGVGDLAVGPRVKGMAKSFYGRVAAYERGLDAAAAAGTLEAALRRNAYGTLRPQGPGQEAVAALAAYVRAADAALAAQDPGGIIGGRPAFPSTGNAPARD